MKNIPKLPTLKVASPQSRKKSNQTKRVTSNLALIGALALGACSDEPNSNPHNAADAGVSDTQRPSRDVGNNFDTSETSDTTPDTATGDVQVDADSNLDSTPDSIITDTNASDSTSDSTSDSNTSEPTEPTDTTTDTESESETDSDLPITPPVYLNVANLGGNFQVLNPTTDSGIVDIANFELCAENGDFAIDSIRAKINGNFELIPATLNINGISRPVAIRGGDRTVTLLATDEDFTINIADGECSNLTLSTDYTNLVDPYAKWFRPEIDLVGSSTLGAVARRATDGITINPLFSRSSVVGTHTVFDPSNSFRVTSRLERPIDQTVYIPSSETNFTVGLFEATTFDEELASIYGTKFRVETVPSTAQLPIRIEYYYHDRIQNLYFSLGGFSAIYQNGDEININHGTFGEDINFGNYIQYRATAFFVPEGLEGARIDLVQIDTDEDTSATYVLNNPYSESRSLPLSWNNLEFVETSPVTVATGHLAYFNNDNSGWYVWPTPDGDIFRQNCTEPSCPLFYLNMEVEGITDPRIPAVLNGFNIDINNRSDDELTFNLKLVTGYPGGFEYVEHVIATVTASPNSVTPIDFRDLGIQLNTINDYRFRLSIDLPDSSLPTINPTNLLPEYINFEINDVDIEHNDTAVDVAINGREFPGDGSYLSNPLPYQAANIYFGSPQIWVDTVSTRFQAVDMPDYVSGTPINLFESTFDNVYGNVRVCEVLFGHDVAKARPPFENIYAVVDGNIAINTFWDRTRAAFRFDNCPLIDADTQFAVRLEGANPIFETSDPAEIRTRFTLNLLRASAVLNEGDFRIFETPIYVDLDAVGEPITLETQPVNGSITLFRR